MTNGVEFDSLTGTGSIFTIPVKSGTYAFRSNPTAATGYVKYSFSSTTFNSGPVIAYYRFYLRIATAPSAQTAIFRIDDEDGDTLIEFTLETDSTLQLNFSGTFSIALSLDTWYMIEISLNQTTKTSSIVSARLDTEQFDSHTTNLVNFGYQGKILIGSQYTATTDLYFDDIAINNSTGSFQNSWPGEGSIVHLRPSAAGDTDAWDLTTTFEDIDEVTPDDATTIISSLTSEDLHEVNIDDTPSALTSNHLIPVVQVGVRFNESVGTDPDPTFVLRIKASASGTVEESGTISATSTTYGTNTPASAAPANYTLTLYNLPGSDTVPYTKTELDTTQIGVRLTNSPVGLAQVSTLWLLVEYALRKSGTPHNYERYLRVGNGTSRAEAAK